MQNDKHMNWNMEEQLLTEAVKSKFFSDLQIAH